MAVETKLYPEQLVIEALEVFIARDEEVLPIVENNRCIGMLYLKDLIWMLTFDPKKQDLLFHKFNFDLRTAIHFMESHVG